MCANAHVLKLFLIPYLAIVISCTGCAIPLSHLWNKENKETEPPPVDANQVWDSSASNNTMEAPLQEGNIPFEPDPSAKYKWIVNNDFSFQLPTSVSARVAARDTLLVVEYTALSAAVIIGFFCGRGGGCCLSGCSCPWSSTPPVSP
jgi:hypothetical protein